MISDCLLSVRGEVLGLIATFLGSWSIPNLTAAIPAIGITPDPDSGDTYPPPGTQLDNGVECIVRVVDFSAPWLDADTYLVVVEVVLAAPISIASVLSAAQAILIGDGAYFIHSSQLSTNNGASQKIIKLRTNRRIKING